MNDYYDKSNTWETRRQKLIELLTVFHYSVELKDLMRLLEYSNKKEMLNDVASVAKILKIKGINLVAIPPICLSCGFSFPIKGFQLKIPSKCPKCRRERVRWPSIKVINNSNRK